LVKQSSAYRNAPLAIHILLASLAAMSLGQARLSALPAASPCLLTAGSVDEPNEGGTTDYSEFQRPAGVVKAVMLFVEFPDADHRESTRDLYKLLVPHAQQWIQEVSYGRADLEVTPVAKWYRMSKPSVEYGFTSKVPPMTDEQHKAYITEAMRLAESDVDFRRYQLVTVVAALGSQIPPSPTFQAPVGKGILIQGTEIHEAITFGADIRRVIPNFGAKVFVHEMGHVFGLPDLYDYLAPRSLQWRFAGGWSVMSANITGGHYFAYNKLKLGWLDADQVKCMTTPGTVEAEITPLETRGGVKAIMVRTGPSNAYAVEVRQKIGEDAGLCDEGALIYTIDATKSNGYGPIRLIPAQEGTDPLMIDKCGILYDATYDLRPGKPPGFSDTNAGISVTLLRKRGRAYTVRVVWRKTG
jgi:M6 family metalloprotease-like protein